jgi:uncharacterized protein with HEPN domain
MTEKEKKFLSDISNSIELIENFTKEINSFTEYQKDLKTKGAVERHLGIIGEAVNKFLKESKTNDLKSASNYKFEKQIDSLVRQRRRLNHLVNCNPTFKTT